MDPSTLSQLRWGAGGIWSLVTPQQKARDPWLHHARMCPVGKSSGVNTSWLPPVSNQSLQWGTGESQHTCPLQPALCVTSGDHTDHGTDSVHAKTSRDTTQPQKKPQNQGLLSLQANICTGNSLEGSFPPEATSGNAHLGPPWGHPHTQGIYWER